MPESHASAARDRAEPGPPEAASERFGPGERVAVLLPLPLTGPYDYLVPPDLELGPGDIVRAPLGSREATGAVWDSAPDAQDAQGKALPDSRLKNVLERFDVPPLDAVERRFIDWVARYTMTRPGAVLRMALSVPEALQPPKPLTAYRLAADYEVRLEGPPAIRMTDARRRVIEELRDGPARTPAELARAAGVGPGVVKGLRDAGLLESVALSVRVPFAVPDPGCAGPALSPDQDAAAQELRMRVADGGFGVTLLDGVTGAGKTEVYLEAVAATLAAGRQVLVLLPEIALSAQALDRFAQRFGVPPAVWHSELTAAQRRDTWRAVALGEARVVLGARSALFLPFHELGLIVVDEEHDAAFKQEDGVIYHARDMAVVRARLGDIPAVLVSATPSLESVHNCRTGRYQRLHLPDRHGGAALPAIELVDLRRDRPARIESQGQSWLSARLRR
ncbi:MAG TPA: primosomal protein N', partial [Kiloniellales bacterium]|nr:primosomal protein N' [Kiloniellales bacterium]